MIVTSLNIAGLSAPDIYTQIVKPPSYVRGVPTDVIGLCGTASWGQLNKPVHLGSGQDAVANFGAMSAASLTDPYDLATDLFLAFGQATSEATLEGWAVRVSDGTDVAALAAIPGAAALLKTATLSGSIAASDVLNIIFTSSSLTGSPITVSVTASGIDTLTTLAAKFATAINANTVLKAAGVYATSAVAVVNIYSAAAISPAITYTSSVSPGSETVTLAAGTSLSAGVTLTAVSTGVLGNQIGINVQAGAITNTWTVTVLPFAGTPEVYSNIPGGIGFWQTLVNALANGLNGVRGPSQYVRGSNVNPAVGDPTAQTTVLAGGTDGRAGVTAATLLGSDTAIPRTGIFALRGVSPAVGIAWMVGVTDTTVAANFLTFGLTEAVSCLFSFAAGQTTAQALATRASTGISDAAWLWTKDWIYMFDPINNVTRLVPETAVVGGEWATQGPAESALNQPVNLVVGTERNNPISGNTPYTESEIGQLQNAGILVITNPVPGGQYFGIRTGASTSADPVTAPMEWWRLTAFIARSLDKGMGKFVGQLQSQQPNDPLRNSVKSNLNNFINLLVGAGQADSGVGICALSTSQTAKPGMGINTPTSIQQHFLFALCQITYLSSVWFFVVQLQGGTTVVTVQPGQQVTPPT